ncbi:MAG: zinc ribbon domain-containing protein [bacterium]
MIKSQRTTSKYFNQSKFEDVKNILKQIAIYKNTLSVHIFNNKVLLLSSEGVKRLKSDYKIVKDDYIPAWNIQREMSMLVDKYIITLQKITQNKHIGIQDKIIIVKYKKDVKFNKKGDTKLFEIKFKSTKLSGLIKYLIYLDFSKPLESQIANENVLAVYEYFKTKPYFARILNLANQIQSSILSKIKLKEIPEYSSVMLSNSVNVAHISLDDSNAKFKAWFGFKMKGRKTINLPVQINDKYHKIKDWIAKEFVLSLSLKQNKINISTTLEEPAPVFKPYVKAEGLDINIKNNFAAMSDGKMFDYDRKLVKDITGELLTLDKIISESPDNKLSDKQLKKLQKLHRKLQWYIGLEIHNILNYCEENGISDLVVENLLFRDKLGVINDEFNMKYSRLLKLLRLNDVKNMFKRQGEKRGIRVHITHSEYSSIACECGNISHSNRATQEVFKCVSCGAEKNADVHAADNLKSRLLVNVLREKLHNLDDFGRLIPKKLNKYVIKYILNERFELTCSS